MFSTYIASFGVLLQTATDDVTDLSASLLRDNDVTSCLQIPNHGSAQRYLKARMSWPIVNNENPNYTVTIIGSNLQCDDKHVLVYMKVTVTWGGPSFKGDYKMCAFISQSEDSSTSACFYQCSPSPDYSEALFVYIRNVVSTTELCEVQYSQ